MARRGERSGVALSSRTVKSRGPAFDSALTETDYGWAILNAASGGFNSLASGILGSVCSFGSSVLRCINGLASSVLGGISGFRCCVFGSQRQRPWLRRLWRRLPGWKQQQESSRSSGREPVQQLVLSFLPQRRGQREERGDQEGLFHFVSLAT